MFGIVYTILTASNVSDAFASTAVNTNLPSGFKTSLSYDPTHAYLDLSLAFVPPPASAKPARVSGEKR